MKEDCYIVEHRNYADAASVCAFRRAEDAKKEIEEDVSETVKSLSEQGHEVEILKSFDRIEVYVPDSDIYYEWELFESSIR